MYDHIPLPVYCGQAFTYQTGWAFTVTGACGNTYHIRNVTYPTPLDAEKAMLTFVERLNLT
ncbi:MAG: hypothetical protein IM557_11245 [Chitinophagaceae bacterium]|nr:hypothetical protein [Chitinophagaceae bacterium]